MKTTIKLMVVLALALATFSQHTIASAGDNFKFSGRFADAFFYSTDGVCVETFVSVFANKGKFQSPPGPGSTSTFASVWVGQFDSCTGIGFSGYGDTFPGDGAFQIDRSLTSAALNVTIPVFDGVSWFDADVNLVWTGTGELSRGTFHSHSKSPGCVINQRWSGSSRPAQASGTVSIEGTNFTPDSSVGATLGSTKSGDLFIGCN